MSEKCSCKNSERIDAQLEINCLECNKPVDRIHIKRPIKAAAIAAFVAYLGGQGVEYAVSDNRYPLDVEQELLSSCMNSYQEPVSRRIYGSRKRVCLCALQGTMNDISYVRFMAEEAIFEKKFFLDAFEENAEACMEEE